MMMMMMTTAAALPCRMPGSAAVFTDKQLYRHQKSSGVDAHCVFMMMNALNLRLLASAKPLRLLRSDAVVFEHINKVLITF